MNNNQRDFIEFVNERMDYNSVSELERNFEDVISDFIDNEIDIYYTELEKWLTECYKAIEYMEYVAHEGWIDFKHYDFYNHIQYAQSEYIRDYFTCDFDTWLQTLKETQHVIGVLHLSNFGGLQILECSNDYEVFYIDQDNETVVYDEIYEDDNSDYYFNYWNDNDPIYLKDIMIVRG